MIKSATPKKRSASILRGQITRRQLLNGLLFTGIYSGVSPLGRTADVNTLNPPAWLDALNTLGQAYLDQYTCPDSVSNERLLILYGVENDQRNGIGSFYIDPGLGKPNRCDLHPRWSPDARQVCIDSVHEHERQTYLVEVSSLTAPAD